MKIVTEGTNNIKHERICYALPNEDEFTLSNYTEDEAEEIYDKTGDYPEDHVLVTFFDSTTARNKMIVYGVYYMDRGKDFKSLAAASAFLKGHGFIL